MDEILDHLKPLLILHEGYKEKPYVDSVGKLTIGIGHNLDDLGLSPAIIDLIFREDVENARTGLLKALPWVSSLDPVRQVVLLDMTFNMGIGKLLTFKNTLPLIQKGAWDAAAANMEQSLWYRQVGKRGKRLVQMMKTGEWPSDVTF